MDRKLPIYKLVMPADVENGGVNFVALVNNPAIQTNWFSFNNHIKFAAEPDRQIVTMPLMIADLPIYRRDEERGEYYVVFDGEQIEKIQNKFMENGFLHNVNEMHDPNKKVGNVFLINSFLSDKQMGIAAPEMFKDMPNKTWFGSYKFKDKNYFDSVVKSGEFQGVSVEGVFDLVDEKHQMEKAIQKKANEILS